MANGYGAEYGVVLPTGDATNTLQFALQQRERLRQEKLLRERQQRDQQEDLAKFLDTELDYSKFATGTPADPVNIAAIKDLRTKYAGQILQGKYNSTASLMYDMQNDLGKVVDYSSNAKLVQANINKSLEGLKDAEGIDLDALRKGAVRSAFMQVDPITGQPVVNPQVDAGQDYVKRYLKEHPDKVVTGPQAITNMFSKLKTTGYTDVIQTDQKGKKRRIEVAADLLPHQEIEMKNGEPIGVRFKTEDLTLPDGSVIKGLPKAAFDEFYSAPGAAAIIDMEMKRQYPNAVEGSSDYTALMQKVGLDVANQYGRGGKFSRKDISDQDVWAGKQQAGITINTGGKEKKENVFDVLKNIKQGDLSYLSDTTPDANGLIDITPALPGSIMYSGRIKKTADGTASKEAFNKMLFNPSTKTFWYQDEKRGKNKGLVEIKQGEEKAFFQKLAEANGVPVKEFLKIWESFGGGAPAQSSGIGKNIQGILDKVNKYLPKFSKPKTDTKPKKASSGITWK